MKRLYLETVESTNLYSKKHINEIDDKTIVYTYNQTAGRGRLNRSWNNTGMDNIYASIVLKPSLKMKDIYSNLTQYLCVILANVIDSYRVKSTIKWPNDVKVNGKKISGILAESIMSGTNLDGIVLGFGVNLNTSAEILKNINQPATSLNIEAGMAIDKEIFLQKVSEDFCLRYDSFIETGFPLIREEYIKRAEFPGQKITVKVFDKDITGIVKQITDNGALEIVDNNNKTHILYIGDIL